MIDGKRGTKSTSAGTHTVAQWLVANNLDLLLGKKTKKEKLDLNYHEYNCCCGLCGQLDQRYNNQAVTNSIVRKLEKLVIVS